MTTVDVHVLSGAYALGAVSGLERAAFERHLTVCGVCRAEVAELRETAGRLADATWSVPPTALRDQVLDRVRQTRQDRPRIAAEPAAPKPAGWSRRAVLAVAAAAAVLAGGGTGYLAQHGHVDEQRAAAARTRARAAAVAAVLSAPDVRMHSVAAGDVGRLNVAVSPSRDTAVVLLAGVPDPDPDHVYRLWLMRGATATPAGSLPPGEAVPAPLHGVRTLAVTLEPGGGPDVPTGPRIARADLA